MTALGVVRSMTGFGAGSAQREGIRADVEIRGVNNRYLDVRLKLPQDVAGMDQDLRRRVQARMARGRVDAVIQIDSDTAGTPRLEVRTALVDEYVAAARALKRRHRLRGSLDVDRLLALPGVVQVVPPVPLATEPAADAVLEAFDKALDAFEAMRLAEGARLLLDLSSRIAEIESSVVRITQESDRAPAAYAERLQERVAGLSQGQRLDPQRLAQEVALLADRLDLTEEVVRLRGYLEQVRSTVATAQGPVGKSLDFVMQEMNREANTISSKSESLVVCQEALKIRSLVEAIREQVQNIE